jgi:hypothetical protein
MCLRNSNPAEKATTFFVRFTAMSCLTLAVANGQETTSDRHTEVLDCRSVEPFEYRWEEVFLDSDGLGESVPIADVVRQLLALDAEGSRAVLDYEFPADWVEEVEGKRYEVLVDMYLDVSFARAAKCLIENTEPEDDIRRYAHSSAERNEEGFVVLRDGKVVVRLLTYQLIAD